MKFYDIFCVTGRLLHKDHLSVVCPFFCPLHLDVLACLSWGLDWFYLKHQQCLESHMVVGWGVKQKYKIPDEFHFLF